MNKILKNQELESFIKENKIDCYSIIIKVNKEKKTASYVIDGEKVIKAKYSEIIKYLD